MIVLPMKTDTSPTVDLIKQLVDRCNVVAVKKLSRNDRSWAEAGLRRENGDKKSNQGGPYIPFEIRQENFFPGLVARDDAPHILEAFVETCWLRTGEIRESRLVNYSNKGKECHLTRVPKDEFSGIGPASFLVIGKTEEGGRASYSCLVVDSAEDDTCVFLETLFDIGPVFEAKLFAGFPVGTLRDDDGLASAILNAIATGSISSLFASYDIPKPIVLAAEAQAAYLSKYDLKNLNPFDLSYPGDSLMEISRDIELGIYTKHHTRHYATKLAGLLAPDSPNPSVADVIGTLARNFGAIYKEVMLSAVQRMKVRAGASFEHHVRRMLSDGSLPFDEQKPSGNQRPDFILPSLSRLHLSTRLRDEALILSLKTTLRERWKQVVKEARNCDVFLATVDDKVAADAIADMRDDGIYLVVPESLKRSKYAEYEGRSNVITFKDFFESDLAIKRKPIWLATGIPCAFGQAIE